MLLGAYTNAFPLTTSEGFYKMHECERHVRTSRLRNAIAGVRHHLLLALENC